MKDKFIGFMAGFTVIIVSSLFVIWVILKLMNCISNEFSKLMP